VEHLSAVRPAGSGREIVSEIAVFFLCHDCRGGDRFIRMNRTSIAASALFFLLATAAQASESGFYLFATGGTSEESPESIGINLGSSEGIIHVDPQRVEVDDGAFAWGVGLGYRINRYLAGELEYADFGTTDVHEHYSDPDQPFPFPTEFDLTYSNKVTGPVVSVVGTLPLGQNFELFLRGGALFASREFNLEGQPTFEGQGQKFASTVWLGGAGATWSFAQRWGVRAEYQQSGSLDRTLLTGETKVKRISLSALYRF
jgi:OmpA-OmpF porin, OOP family